MLPCAVSVSPSVSGIGAGGKLDRVAGPGLEDRLRRASPGPVSSSEVDLQRRRAAPLERSSDERDRGQRRAGASFRPRRADARDVLAGRLDRGRPGGGRGRRTGPAAPSPCSRRCAGSRSSSSRSRARSSARAPRGCAGGWRAASGSPRPRGSRAGSRGRRARSRAGWSSGSPRSGR